MKEGQKTNVNRCRMCVRTYVLYAYMYACIYVVCVYVCMYVLQLFIVPRGSKWSDHLVTLLDTFLTIFFVRQIDETVSAYHGSLNPRRGGAEIHSPPRCFTRYVWRSVGWLTSPLK